MHENKKIVTSGKMTSSLIISWIVDGLLLGFLYSFIIVSIGQTIKSTVVLSLISVILQGIIAILVWKIATSSAFKKKTISFQDVSKVMKNLIIFTIIIILINLGTGISDANTAIDEALESDVNLKLYEDTLNKYSQFIDDESIIQEYEQKRDNRIKEIKTEVYTYAIIYNAGLLIVHLLVLPLEKKFILKYVRKEEVEVINF